ncbi:MAG: SagB/ThcOx family dehydrogenase [Acidimicrobiales bacterium]|jgi:SagB-type dehydrogenase family enzyme
MAAHEPDIASLYHRHSSYNEDVLPEPADPDEVTGWATTYPGAARVALPGRETPLETSLGAALAGRRTVRRFVAGDPMPLELLGALLHASFGIQPRPRPGPDEPADRRPSPSAGGRYPLELHVLTQSLGELADGLYHYDPRAHELEARRLGAWRERLTAATLRHAMLVDCNAVVTIVGVPRRTMTKYGQRGYRFMLLDAGHLAQNLCLVATALGLGALPVGGFYDDRLHDLLELSADEWPLYLVGIGRSEATA